LFSLTDKSRLSPAMDVTAFAVNAVKIDGRRHVVLGELAINLLVENSLLALTQ
jgi:hypothetical protein